MSDLIDFSEASLARRYWKSLSGHHVRAAKKGLKPGQLKLAENAKEIRAANKATRKVQKTVSRDLNTKATNKKIAKTRKELKEAGTPDHLLPKYKETTGVTVADQRAGSHIQHDRLAKERQSISDSLSDGNKALRKARLNQAGTVAVTAAGVGGVGTLAAIPAISKANQTEQREQGKLFTPEGRAERLEQERRKFHQTNNQLEQKRRGFNGDMETIDFGYGRVGMPIGKKLKLRTLRKHPAKKPGLLKLRRTQPYNHGLKVPATRFSSEDLLCELDEILDTIDFSKRAAWNAGRMNRQRRIMRKRNLKLDKNDVRIGEKRLKHYQKAGEHSQKGNKFRSEWNAQMGDTAGVSQDISNKMRTVLDNRNIGKMDKIGSRASGTTHGGSRTERTIHHVSKNAERYAGGAAGVGIAGGIGAGVLVNNKKKQNLSSEALLNELDAVLDTVDFGDYERKQKRLQRVADKTGNKQKKIAKKYYKAKYTGDPEGAAKQTAKYIKVESQFQKKIAKKAKGAPVYTVGTPDIKETKVQRRKRRAAQTQRNKENMTNLLTGK